MPPSGKRQSIVGLHYLRAITTILVVINHAVDTASFPKYFGDGLFTAFFNVGAGEIDFFFIMSGLIMVSSSTDAKTGLPRLSAVEFLKRRAQRIIPMLWFATILFNVALFCAYGRLDLLSSLRTVTFWPVGEVAPFVAWTIRYEVMFYLVFSVCFLWWPRLWPLIFVWSAVSLFRYAFGDGVAVDDGTLAGFLFSPYYIEFGIGIALGLLMRRWTGSIELPFQLPILIALTLLLRVFVLHFDLKMGSLAMILSIAPMCIAMMLIAVCTTPRRISRVAMAIGDASYSIFLLHPIFISPILVLFLKIAPGMPSTMAAGLSAVLSAGLGYLAHIWIERRFSNIDWSRYFKLSQGGIVK